MWKTHHMAVLAVAVTILSVTLTLYTQSKLKNVIAAKAAELADPNSLHSLPNNPIQLMSALSSKKIHPDDKVKSLIPPPPVVPHAFADEVKPPKSPPKGSGSRWTPL